MYRKLALGAAAAGAACVASLPSAAVSSSSSTSCASAKSDGSAKKNKPARREEDAEKALFKEQRTIFLSGEVDDKQYSNAKHLVLQGWFTSSQLYDASMLERGYDVLKMRAKGSDRSVVGLTVSGDTGAVSALSATQE